MRYLFREERRSCLVLWLFSVDDWSLFPFASWLCFDLGRSLTTSQSSLSFLANTPFSRLVLHYSFPILICPFSSPLGTFTFVPPVWRTLPRGALSFLFISWGRRLNCFICRYCPYRRSIAVRPTYGLAYSGTTCFGTLRPSRAS